MKSSMAWKIALIVIFLAISAFAENSVRRFDEDTVRFTALVSGLITTIMTCQVDSVDINDWF